MFKLKNLNPREYQSNILKTAEKQNTLVVLPTGLGKTLIALMLALKRLELFPKSKILLLAPTRPLVEQHFEYFKKNIENSESLNLHLFTGKINNKQRAEIWENADIIFSTPQCIQNDLKNNLINLDNVSLLVEDESHRCLKNYAYTYVAEKYKQQSKEKQLLLGITASPSSESLKIKEICKNLNIKAVEIRTRDSPDVTKYLQKLESDIVRVDFPEEFNNIKILLSSIYHKKIEELESRKLIYGNTSKSSLLILQKRLANKVNNDYKDFNSMRGMSLCSQAIKIQHALELLETQTLESFYSYLKDLFEQTKQNKSKGVKQITTSKEFADAYLLTINLYQKGIEHPKLNKLMEIIKQEKEIKPNLKAIIFAQFRNTVKKIDQILKSNKLKSSIFIGQAIKDGKGFSQKEQHEVIDQFKKGEINFLVSTSIGEEGLDIPEVDLVIFYEPIPSAIRKIQRTGRTARLKPGKLITLVTRKTRDEAHHWSAQNKEKKMGIELQKIKDHFETKKIFSKQKSLGEF